MSAPPPPPMNYLITGAARGIGRHLTRTLISRGHRVFLIDNDATELSHTLSLLPQLAPTSTTTPPFATPSATTDLASVSAIKSAVAEARTFFNGRLDVLINNAMAMPHTLPANIAESMTSDQEAALEAHWERQLAVGLSAPFHLTRLCLDMLRGDVDQGGRMGCVVNVSSTRAGMAEEGHEGYSAAKAGLLGLGQGMAVTLRGKVRVNSLVLGWVEVGEESKEGEGRGWGEELTKEDHEWHLAGRVGKGQDVMRAVDYLVESEWVTGSEVVLDGGVTRKMVYPE